MSTPTNNPTHTNRLAHETSPYLLQHQHNPVDWYPWGPEAFARARREDKPIFLSVGYSTCYWCHVMERQSFEVESVAAEMNSRFINIKVDREERPDVDQLYMIAVQVLTRHGGWPMSVWLTPDLRPFHGGTYFPPQNFVQILRGLEDAWKNRRAEVMEVADHLRDVLRQVAEPQSPRTKLTIDPALIDNLVKRSAADYEPRYGGFGHAPKFPRETMLELLLAWLGQEEVRGQKSEIRNRLFHSLDAMADGGIRDHLGGGFHRYSTDAKWLVPHFEIMLYDNAMLAVCYAEAFEQSGEQRYAAVTREVLDYTLREMTSPQGAFYTAFDAEVDAQEGLSYLWTPDEVVAVLGTDDGTFFNGVYGLSQGFNFADPHHGSGTPDKNVLHVERREVDGVHPIHHERLKQLRQKLYEARLKRKQPLLDTKVITSWNGLMIRAMAHAGRVLNEPRYVEAAGKAADFLLTAHQKPDGTFWRTSRIGQFKHDAMLDDYAFLAHALLELERAGQPHRRAQAERIADTMIARFHDDNHGGFYFTAEGATDLIVRQKVAQDSPLPSGNAVAARVLIELGRTDLAASVLRVFARQIEGQGEGMSSMVHAAMEYLARHGPLTIEPGPAAAPDRPLSPQEIAAGVVDVQAAWRSPTELHLQLEIADTFHVNAHQASEGLIPTAVNLPDPALSRIDYPPGEARSFAFAPQPIRVYEGRVIIALHFNGPMSNHGPLTLALTYQACTDDACLPPVTKQFELNTP